MFFGFYPIKLIFLPCNRWRTNKSWLMPRRCFILNFRCDSVYVGILPTFHTIFTCHFDQSNEHTKYCYDFTLIFLVKLEKGLFKKQIDTLSSVCHNSGLEQYWRKISKIAVLALERYRFRSKRACAVDCLIACHPTSRLLLFLAL